MLFFILGFNQLAKISFIPKGTKYLFLIFFSESYHILWHLVALILWLSLQKHTLSIVVSDNDVFWKLLKKQSPSSFSILKVLPISLLPQQKLGGLNNPEIFEETSSTRFFIRHCFRPRLKIGRET